MSFEYRFDAGIDPDYRIAPDSASLAGAAGMLSLKRLSETYGIQGGFVAKLLPESARGENGSPNDALCVGADILRDCYGKIDSFVFPVSAPVDAGEICKIIKALRSKTRITAVTAAGGEGTGSFPDRLPDGFPLDRIDETVAVRAEDAVKAQNEAAAAEGIAVDLPSGAALFAAADAAKRFGDRHSRCVVLLTRAAE